ncbi:MAG: P-II family nitrogen regulator [Coriobacteriaceae bacterium]|nr:P-II family nitrogen regulator [Coriobacteriaceae bacterium]
MKKIQAIIRPEKLEPLKDAVQDAGIGGMTVSNVHGCGMQQGYTEYFRGTEILLNMRAKIQCEFVVDDSAVDGLVDVICETCRTGEVGDGKIFIIPIEDAIRIRTGERGEKAV